MPNNFAYIALILWPFISLLFYKRLPIVHATFWTIVGGFLALPVRIYIDFPLIPPLGKESIPVISALIGCIYIKKIKIKFIPSDGLERWLIVILLITPLITMLNNQEAYNFIPGLTIHDALSATINQYIKVLPFILGLQLIKTYDDQIVLFKLLATSAILYSVLVLFEIRMSPQLHTWVYGYFPHSFGQQFRFDGFRAVVFMGHGLIVSMYIAISLGALTILMRQKIKIYGVSIWVFILYFLILLVLNKTVSGFLLGLFLFVAIAWLSVNMLRRLSIVLMGIVLLYPALLIMELFPYKQLIELATNFDLERGESLAFRFRHESALLDHAKDKLFFGWGGWNRNRIVGSVKDGYWIGVFGVQGLVGFVSLFGLAALSVLKASKLCRQLKNTNEQYLLIGHALIISIIMIDQLPNSSFYAWAVFIIGALLGRSNSIRNTSALNYSKPITVTNKFLEKSKK